MKRLTPPELLSPPHGSQQLSLTDADAIMRLAKKLADGSRPGALIVRDDQGQLHSRRMATLGLEAFPCFYAISSPACREVAWLEHQPVVSWRFTDTAMPLAITLTGQAGVVRDASLLNRAWKEMGPRTRELMQADHALTHGLVLIKTVVENIDCTIPREKFKTLVDRFLL